MRPGFGIGQHRTIPSPAVDWGAARATVELVSGKWTIAVLAALFSGPRRHGSLRRAVGVRVSDKVLTETLRRMERDGLLVRQVGTGTPPAVTYSLSRTGRSLAGPLGVLAEWHFTRSRE